MGQVNTISVFLEEPVLSSSRAPGSEITVHLLCDLTALFVAEGLPPMRTRRKFDRRKMQLFAKTERSTVIIFANSCNREVHHDLESSILVLFHSVMKRDLERRLWHSQIQEFYGIVLCSAVILFGSSDKDVLFSRWERSPCVSFRCSGLANGTTILWLSEAFENSAILQLSYNESITEIDQKMQWQSGSEELKVITHAACPVVCRQRREG